MIGKSGLAHTVLLVVMLPARTCKTFSVLLCAISPTTIHSTSPCFYRSLNTIEHSAHQHQHLSNWRSSSSIPANVSALLDPLSPLLMPSMRVVTSWTPSSLWLLVTVLNMTCTHMTIMFTIHALSLSMLIPLSMLCLPAHASLSSLHHIHIPQWPV